MFCLNDKQTKLREELRAFVEDNLSPQAVELEDSGAFPRELFRRLGRQGYLDMCFYHQRPDAALSLIHISEPTRP